MFNLNNLKNKIFYVAGLGNSGNAVIKFLNKHNIQYYYFDDNIIDKNATNPGIAPWERIDALIVSPGIDNEHIAIEVAKKYNISVICDIEILSELKQKIKTVGITGTNGKSTTATLIHYLLKQNKTSAILGGILGFQFYPKKIWKTWLITMFWNFPHTNWNV